jgi:malonyl-CoA decarboxylase
MPILDTSVNPIEPHSANTAVFYSISNCQMALKGVSFGSFLIKQVVSEIQLEYNQITQFVTLSPVPGLRKWAEKINLSDTNGIPEQIIKDVQTCVGNSSPGIASLRRLTYYYLSQAKNIKGDALNSVAHFHLGNGAYLFDIHTKANDNQSALDDSWGVMVNYLYDLDLVAKNHEDYANQKLVSASSKLTKSIQIKKKKNLSLLV